MNPDDGPTDRSLIAGGLFLREDHKLNDKLFNDDRSAMSPAHLTRPDDRRVIL